MVSGWMMYWLVYYFMNRTHNHLLFVAMGDRHQLNPVRSFHNIFSFKDFKGICNVHSIDFVESKRFVPEYELTIKKLRDFVDSGNEEGLFQYVREKYPVVQCIDAPMLKEASRAMAFLNVTVDAYNKFYLQNMLPGKEIRLCCIQNDQNIKRL